MRRVTEALTELKCPSCWRNSASVYSRTSQYRRLIIVSLRCPDCQHRWQTTQDEKDRPVPLLRPRPDRRREERERNEQPDRR